MIDLEKCKTDVAYRLVARQALLDSFEVFVLHFFYWTYKKRFLWNHHHGMIVSVLERVHAGGITYCIINIPPRYSKTELVIKLFPAWGYAKNSACNNIHLSYSDKLAIDNSDSIRDIIKGEAFQLFFPEITIKPNKDSKKQWSTSSNGEFYATAAGGSVTGFGAGAVEETDEDGNFVYSGAILIDDPLKPDDAHSEAKRGSVNRRWDETIKNRRNGPRTPVIVVMQRLHEDDFCATLEQDEEFDWTLLCLPALDKDGKALWPKKHTAKQLKAMKKKNSYVFAGQYQQTPTPEGGGIFKSKWWRYYVKMPPKIKYRFIVGDTGQKAKTVHDYTVFMCFAFAEDRLYIEDMIRGKWEAPELEIQYCAFWDKWKPAKPRPRFSSIEDKVSGTGLIQRIQRKAHSPIRSMQRNTDKVTRAMDTAPYIESGYVLIPMTAPWLSDFLAEMGSFTAAMTHKNDDICDVVFDGCKIAFQDIKTSIFDVVGKR
ncbi:phage terminase large subunit [Candidatus Pacearchaeota archaeon]|nr:phage terminase large subunit [Candidatus Pacearchaeota archaeon]